MKLPAWMSVFAVGMGLTLGAFAGQKVATSHAPAQPAAAAPHPASFEVPNSPGEPVVDGEFEDEAWVGAARSGSFRSGDAPARPYSDARFSWHAGTLFMTLYAADEDIRAATANHDDPLWTGDMFAVFIETNGVVHEIDVSARGVLTDGIRTSGRFDASWESLARVAVDRDGTVDDSSDEDEEWVAELGVPLSSLGIQGRAGEKLRVSIERCDSVVWPGESARRRVCARWPEQGNTELVLAPERR